MEQVRVYARRSSPDQDKQKATRRSRAGLLLLSLAVFGLGFFLSTTTRKADEKAILGNAAIAEEVPIAVTQDWRLILVNPWNDVPDSLEITLKQLENGQAVDERIYPDLQDMLADCRATGLSPLICSSYRTQEDQQYLFNNKVNRLRAQGYSEEEAKTEAAKAVAVPGTSEHQLGLALDIVDTNNQNLDSSQENTPVQKWLMANSWKYGFILRYPKGKSEITGIIYEPWHYRYVGKEAAADIVARGITLEEYLAEEAPASSGR